MICWYRMARPFCLQTLALLCVLVACSTAAHANGNIQLTTVAGVNQYWFSFTVADHNKSISKVEIRDDFNHQFWLQMTANSSTEYVIQDLGQQLTAPLSVRITAIDNEVLNGSDVIGNFSGSTTWDYGSNFTLLAPVPIAGAAAAMVAVLLGGLGILRAR